VTGAAAITVRAPVPATISVQNITITGTNNVTANVNNIAGSIDVNLNVDPGEQIVQRVEVLIDGNVACTQNLSGAQSEAMRLAATFEELEQVIVSCQINTAAFSSATGIADFFNGAHTLSGRAVLASGSQVATPSTPLVFNNQSGVIAVVSNTNGTDAASAINPGTGLQWIGGGVTIDLTGVSYVANTTIASVNCTIFGKSPVIPLTNGKATVTWTEATAAWSGTNTSVTNYLSPAAESIACPSAILSNGQPLVVAGGTTPLLNFGAPGTTNAAMPVLQVLRLDNTAPGAVSANGVAQNPVSAVVGIIQPLAAPFTTPWVNASSTLTPSATGGTVNVLGLPSLATLNAQTGGVDVEVGVDNIWVAVWVPPGGGALPTTGGACNVTGLTSVDSGDDLMETTVSSAYPVRFVFSDALGNRFCYDLGAFGGSTAIGADFTAPTGTITGPVANTGYNALPPMWSVAPADNASGFTNNPAGPLRVSLTRLGTNNATTCVVGTGTACTAAARPVAFDATGGTGTEGYYTVTIDLVDQAGNATRLITTQLNGYDINNPSFAGGISLPSLIAGATTNTFTASVADNLDLGSIFGVVNYPGAATSIQYPTQTIGTFGPALEQTSNNFGYQVADWIRCLNPQNSFAAAANPPAGITLTVSDQTTIPGTNTASLASPAFGANAQVCSGTVGNVAINSFIQNALVYPGTATQVDLDGASMVAASATTVALQVVADVPLNTSADPFSRVDFYYVNTAGNLVKIGTATPVLSQTITNRTYTYNFTWDPAAPVQTGNVTVVGLGIDAQGDAVFATNATSVTIVP
jgi:hypothetical protein